METRELDDGETVWCPYCDIDSVLGDAAGFPLTDEFLRDMNHRSFDGEDLQIERIL